MTDTLRLGDLLAGEDPSFYGCGPETAVSALVVDSRRVVPGAAFVAVPGLAHDGHTFVPAALAAGAALAIVERGRGITAGPRVELASVADALPRLCARACGEPGEHLRLAGVTGTNGKTTVTFLVAAMLAAAGRKHARIGTTGNWVADREESAAFTTPFPLELQQLLARARERGATDVVMEVSSHALAQGRVRPLRYDAAGLTSFSQDHLDFHATMDDYLAAKCLLPAAHLRPGGVVVAAVDDQPAAARFLAAAPAGARVWRASRGGARGAEIVASSVMSEQTGLKAQVDTPAGPLALRSPLVGAFNLDNLLVAIGLGLGLGLQPEVIGEALASCRGAPGRLERVTVAETSGPTVLVDYAHTPDAVARALQAVRRACSGRLFVVLGCGGDRDPSKRAPMGEFAATLADRFYATSDNPRTEDPQAIVAQMLAGVPPERRDRVVPLVDRRAAIACAIAEAADDDVVVIAGKGHEDYQIVGVEKLHFDDREEAAAALRLRATGRAGAAVREDR
ncbi:UDP-N-acetylmuramoyl-L-alanyl-D-glutamate--2,6-diaminopimelate ligase [Nannocystis radixulma]|uniref:UDP-N-acetylmuramoyl-L-alanyl-D-glutamate--2,6-diaminopimelate ligase n=1 Tax=Nannocystis radixulma TaxID=2995305 RepID=A0ABT5BP40_9BACT|nr:UDP-N-acetylmuramoyl-L-alanyl-D-glutamate--2,6-diaminopimelate ligase [Nannocystis radixulma]MDC0674676.1 UDP-N-acetylmuramoyl-L-alanyl-D-glutamate--2,6-diaminopimelate ligase [Nannocystis radixulma]